MDAPANCIGKLYAVIPSEINETAGVRSHSGAWQTQRSVCAWLKRFVQMGPHHVPFASDEDRRSGSCSRLLQPPAKPSLPRSAPDHNESHFISRLQKTDPPSIIVSMSSVEASPFCPELLSSLVPPSELRNSHGGKARTRRNGVRDPYLCCSNCNGSHSNCDVIKAAL